MCLHVSASMQQAQTQLGSDTCLDTFTVDRGRWVTIQLIVMGQG